MDNEVKDNTTSRSSFGGALRNEDFRQLLARKMVQPASVPSIQTNSNAQTSATSQAQSTHSFSHRKNNESKKIGGGAAKLRRQKERSTEDDEDDIFGPSNLSEIMKNYRDRAEERRRGIGKDETADELQASNAYRAVPGDVRATVDAAQRRKQAIQESKYLGGDMEHTHLVKGLDYSLLHKVRSELAVREQKNEEVLESQFTKESLLEEPRSDNRMVRNIHRLLFQNEPPVRNELFRKGRMAYVVDLEEEENDLPTTRLRSVHDCPAPESTHDINTSNMLIQKLTQVLSYLRADSQKKKKKADIPNALDERAKAASQSIYDDERDFAQPKNPNERERMRDRERRRNKPTSYFDDDDRSRDRDRNREYDRNRDRARRTREDEKQRKEDAPKVVETIPVVEEKKKKKLNTETEGYAECYPGGMYEAAGESDDEADYSKMDMGNRRGPVKRWDFEDHADYEKYMESKEALPKAAYQFGVKTNDGRKTRKSGPDKEKHKLDREFSQITKILEKRKMDGNRSDAPKKTRY